MAYQKIMLLLSENDCTYLDAAAAAAANDDNDDNNNYDTDDYFY